MFSVRLRGSPDFSRTEGPGEAAAAPLGPGKSASQGSASQGRRAPPGSERRCLPRHSLRLISPTRFYTVRQPHGFY